MKKILEYNRCRYYVYCDRPYWSAKQTIEANCIYKKWQVVDFQKFDVICLRVGSFGILFIPVCNSNSFFLDLDRYYRGKKELAKDLFEHKRDMDEFELVINCLFCV